MSPACSPTVCCLLPVSLPVDCGLLPVLQHETLNLPCFWAESAIHEVALQTDFREKGLQVVVDIQSIELTPACPRWEAKNRTPTGRLLQEPIVATAFCCLASTNCGGVALAELLARREPAGFWGDASDTAPMTCCDETFRATRSLWAALVHLRQGDQPRVLLWVDAVCINQDDSDERTQQIGLMRQIYQMATRVVVWLGVADDENTDGAFLLCMRTAHFWTDAETLKTLGHESIVALYKVGSSKHSIDITLDHTGALTLVRHKAERDRSRQGPSQGSRTHPASLLDVCTEFRVTQATDPRDKVYAFLGLVDPPSGPVLATRADYSVDVTTCYTRAMRTILAQSENLDCLRPQRCPQCGLAASSLPTWAVDWSFFDGGVHAYSLGTYHCASGDSRYDPIDPAIDPASMMHPELLRRRGYILETLTAVSKESMPMWYAMDLPEGISTSPSAEEAPITIKYAVKLLRQAGTAADVTRRWDRFARSLRCATDTDSDTDVDAHRRLLANLLRPDCASSPTELEHGVQSLVSVLRRAKPVVLLRRLGLRKMLPPVFQMLMGLAVPREKMVYLLAINRRLARSDTHLALVPRDTREFHAAGCSLLHRLENFVCELPTFVDLMKWKSFCHFFQFKACRNIKSPKCSTSSFVRELKSGRVWGPFTSLSLCDSINGE